MTQTPTRDIPLGFIAPEFTLPDTVNGKMMSLEDLRSDRGTVIMFICNHCPYVKHVNEGLVRLANDYLPKGISFIAINSNDVENYPEDHPDKMKEVAQKLHFPFAYLYDESQDVARAYFAACTPDFSIFDGEMRCVYRGQLDDSRPGNGKAITGRDIREALDAILRGNPVNEIQKPSVGCNIKWKD